MQPSARTSQRYRAVGAGGCRSFLLLGSQLAVLKQPVGDRPGCELNARAHAQLAEDLAHVDLGGVARNPQSLADLVVVKTLSNERCDLALAASQPAQLLGRGRIVERFTWRHVQSVADNLVERQRASFGPRGDRPLAA